jgi:Zn-dependent peptidase ImmA (M78 family)
MNLRFARREAEKLTDRFGYTHPAVDSYAIARQLGLAVVEELLGDDVSGLLVTNPEKSVIVVNRTDHEHRKRFTIGHEIGHHVLRHQLAEGEHVFVDRGNYISQRGPRASEGIDPMEVEANQFAAALLMPSRLLESAVRALNTKALFDSHVEKLAIDFNVSQQAMTIRLSSLGHL